MASGSHLWLISRVTNDAEAFSRCMRAIRASSWLERVQLFIYSFTRLSVFLVPSCRSSLRILDTSPLSEVCFGNCDSWDL